jgi:hypothetical protein
MARCLIGADGRRWVLAATPQADDLEAVIVEMESTAAAEPLRCLSRQDVAAQIGRGIPADFPAPDVLIGETRGWFVATVQRYLAGAAAEEPEPEPEPAAAVAGPAKKKAGTAKPAAAPQWERGTRAWESVPFSAADHRVLIAASHGIVTPAGQVISRPLGTAADLGKLVANYGWRPAPGNAPQVWLTWEALEAIGFPLDGQTADTIADTVGAFFSGEVGFHQSGFFNLSFTAADGGAARTADVVLMPFAMLDPSTSRPGDRGVIGIDGTDTMLPDEEIPAVQLLADRIGWLHTLEGAQPGPRWARVGAQIAESWIQRARPKPKTAATAPPLVPCPLPAEIAPNGKLPGQFWISENWLRGKHAAAAGPVRQVDQQAAYLASAGGAYLGYGKPGWVNDVDAGVFNDQRPPFGMWLIATPPGADLDLDRRLPLPHPHMNWHGPASFWATTVDVQQLTAPVSNGGVGLAVTELGVDRALVWPEQHQWLKGWTEDLRKALVAARAEGRDDRIAMIKAVYTAYLGRLAAVGTGAFKYPLLHHQQPAWYATIEAITRWRAAKYASRIAADYGLCPTSVLTDAWFYAIPAGFDPALLETPPRPDGTRANGSYRLKDPA